MRIESRSGGAKEPCLESEIFVDGRSIKSGGRRVTDLGSQVAAPSFGLPAQFEMFEHYTED